MRTNNKPNPHDPSLGIEPGPHWWEVIALDHHCAIPAPQKRKLDYCTETPALTGWFQTVYITLPQKVNGNYEANGGKGLTEGKAFKKIVEL